jgi:8-oxo-dGTP pyrophosphatase MutT (NUDIX family)
LPLRLADRNDNVGSTMDKQELEKELHRIANTVIIYKKDDDENRYLITKRSPHKKVYPGKWTVPGGGLHTDDYTGRPKTTTDAWYNVLEDSVRREIQEEVGLEISKPILLVDATFIRPDNIPVLVLSFYAQYILGEVKLDEDSVEAAWIKAVEAGKYDLIEGIGEEIEMVERILDGTDPAEVEFTGKK